jgi:two-component system sensor histidine kinase DegS
MRVLKSARVVLRSFSKLLLNIHFWIVIALFGGGILLHYPQIIPFIEPLEPDSFLFTTRHSIGRLVLLLPITYTALVFGLRAGLVSLGAAILIMTPNIFLLPEINTDDIIEIGGIVVIGLVVNLWLESYWTDKKHRQQAYTRLETAQRELQRMQQNLRFYLKQITIAQEEERRRIAQELHDDTAQDLVVLSRKLDGFISRSSNISEDEINYLEDLHHQINRTLSEVRRFSQDLRPSVLDDLGLLPALEWLTSELSKHFSMDIEIKVQGSARRFPQETELVMFRIAQESLRNIGKHARSKKAWLTLNFSPDKTVLTIKDKGKGFKPPERIGDLAALGKLGLAGMQERVQLIGGQLKITSQPGKGTTVIVTVMASDDINQQP